MEADHSSLPPVSLFPSYVQVKKHLNGTPSHATAGNFRSFVASSFVLFSFLTHNRCRCILIGHFVFPVDVLWPLRYEYVEGGLMDSKPA